MQRVQLAVIGGSGLVHSQHLQLIEKKEISTPFGVPSDAVYLAHVKDRSVFFLARHGDKHQFSPSELNYRANIYALKSLGVTHILAINAVGSMQEDIQPSDLVVPDQIIDLTKGQRHSSFFTDGIVGHIALAEPFCPILRAYALAAARKTGARVHEKACYLCIEGPQFSTKAESHYYRRAMQASIIGMTAMPEAKLAREAEIAYAMIALTTDYDSWKEDETPVSLSGVLETLAKHKTTSLQLVSNLCELLPSEEENVIFSAAKNAIMTQKEAITEAKKKEIELLYGKYFR